MEFVGELFQPIWLIDRTNPPELSFPHRWQIQIEHKCQFRPNFAQQKPFQFSNKLRTQPASMALVNRSRISKSIGNDDTTLCQCRSNDFANQLRPTGAKQEQFGHIIEAIAFPRMQQQLPDRLAYLRCSRVVHNSSRLPSRFQSSYQTRDLRRFTGSFSAFKGNQNAGHERETRNADCRLRNE